MLSRRNSFRLPLDCFRGDVDCSESRSAFVDVFVAYEEARPPELAYTAGSSGSLAWPASRSPWSSLLAGLSPHRLPERRRRPRTKPACERYVVAIGSCISRDSDNPPSAPRIAATAADNATSGFAVSLYPRRLFCPYLFRAGFLSAELRYDTMVYLLALDNALRHSSGVPSPYRMHSCRSKTKRQLCMPIRRLQGGKPWPRLPQLPLA